MEFIDLRSQQKLIYKNLDKSIKSILDHGQYIMGPEVFELEKKLSQFCGAKHSISCANGTDAITLILMAKNIQRNDAVFVPSFTFCATAGVVVNLGAQIIFVDVLPDTFNMDPESLKAGIVKAKSLGLNPAAVITVDLFGQPADYDIIESIVQENDMWLLCDSAQSFGAKYKDRKVGTIGTATSTSFFPAKPLGCYGDGGCVFTDDDELADSIKSIRIHGQGISKYDNIRPGINSRLDTIQAAVLLEKLKIFPGELKKRSELAKKYNDLSRKNIVVPKILDGCESSWSVYTIVLDKGHARSEVQEKLKSNGVPTAVYYPKPLCNQEAYKKCIRSQDVLRVSEHLSKHVLSLPMHPYLDISDEYLSTIVNALIL